MDDETIKKCNDCAPKGLTYSRRDGRAQVMIGQDFLADELGTPEQQFEQAKMLANMMAEGKFGKQYQEGAPKPYPPSTKLPEGPHTQQPQPFEAPQGEPHAPPPNKNFTLADIGLGELIGAGPPKEGAIKNFTLHESTARDVLSGGMFQQNDEDDDDVERLLKRMKVPHDLWEKIKKRFQLRAWAPEMDDPTLEFLLAILVELLTAEPKVPTSSEESPDEMEVDDLEPSFYGEKPCDYSRVFRFHNHRWIRAFPMKVKPTSCCYKQYIGTTPWSGDPDEVKRIANEEVKCRRQAEADLAELEEYATENLLDNLAIFEAMEETFDEDGVPRSLLEAYVEEVSSGLTCEEPCRKTIELLAWDITPMNVRRTLTAAILETKQAEGESEWAEYEEQVVENEDGTKSSKIVRKAHKYSWIRWCLQATLSMRVDFMITVVARIKCVE